MRYTNGIDSIECPYCGHTFNGREACNGDMDCSCVTCPACEEDMFISMCIEYLAEEISDMYK